MAGIINKQSGKIPLTALPCSLVISSLFFALVIVHPVRQLVPVKVTAVGQTLQLDPETQFQKAGFLLYRIVPEYRDDHFSRRQSQELGNGALAEVSHINLRLRGLSVFHGHFPVMFSVQSLFGTDQ